MSRSRRRFPDFGAGGHEPPQSRTSKSRCLIYFERTSAVDANDDQKHLAGAKPVQKVMLTLIAWVLSDASSNALIASFIGKAWVTSGFTSSRALRIIETAVKNSS